MMPERLWAMEIVEIALPDVLEPPPLELTACCWPKGQDPITLELRRARKAMDDAVYCSLVVDAWINPP